jgi:choline dehydrogenase
LDLLKFLQTSGIGNSKKLKNLGIEIIHELKGVGKIYKII